jgi:hypothetical protein
LLTDTTVSSLKCQVIGQLTFKTQDLSTILTSFSVTSTNAALSPMSMVFSTTVKESSLKWLVQVLIASTSMDFPSKWWTWQLNNLQLRSLKSRSTRASAPREMQMAVKMTTTSQLDLCWEPLLLTTSLRKTTDTGLIALKTTTGPTTSAWLLWSSHPWNSTFKTRITLKFCSEALTKSQSTTWCASKLTSEASTYSICSLLATKKV